MKAKKRKSNFKYEVDIQWSLEDQCYIATVPELPGCQTHGDTLQEAAKMAEEAIALYVESLAARGLEIPSPVSEEELSGEFLIRTGDPSLHRRLKMLAKAERKPLNTFVVDGLRKLASGS